MKKPILSILLILVSISGFAGNGIIEPSITCLYATKDSTDLYMDIYYPRTDSVADRRTTIIFTFGGGFKEGHKRESKALKWFKRLTDDGFTVAAIDYRLGMKDYRIKGVDAKFIRAMVKSIKMATEDLISATGYLIDNREILDIDTTRIIASGSSAGAITSLQAEWEICNGTSIAASLPEGFNYAGIISYAGGIFNREGGPVYAKEPCPTLFFHGTTDDIVKYSSIRLGKLFFGGTGSITRHYAKNGYNYNVYRYRGRGHEIAGTMSYSYPETIHFIESNVLDGERRTVDAIVTDPSIPTPEWAKGGAKKLLNKD